MKSQNKQLSGVGQIDSPALKPIGLSRALLFFGLPFLLVAGMFWVVIPLMDLMGVRLFNSIAATCAVVSTIMLVLALQFHRREHRWNALSFVDRFRLKPLAKRDWLWTILLIVISLGSFHFLAFTHSWVAERIEEPKFLIRMLDQDPNYFMEIPADGNWILAMTTVFVIAMSVFVQELWWRGYILPRQESAHGNRAWMVHGLLWWAFTLFVPWFSLRFLVAAFAIPFAVQRLQNIRPGILAQLFLFVPMLADLFSRV